MAAKYPYVGYNLQEIRKENGYTRERLISSLTALGVTARGGVPYSTRAVQSWECGEYAIPDEVKVALCQIFDCRIEKLFFYHMRDSEQYTRRIRARVELADRLNELPTRVVEGLSYILHSWKGNVLPLMELVLAYCSCGNAKKRAEMAASMMFCYREAKESGLLTPNAPDADETFIWEQIRTLDDRIENPSIK